MPDWVADKKRRAEKIREAKAELEAEAKAAAEAKRKAQAEAEKKREAEGRKKPGKPAAPPSEEPDPKAQKNFTDPESRIMKTKDGFIQGYNAQAAVDAEAQVIVAPWPRRQMRQRSASTGADGRRGRSQSGPQAGAGLGRCRLLLGRQSRGAGEARDRRLYRARPGQGRRGTRLSIPDRRGRTGGIAEPPAPSVEAMREKIKAGGHAAPTGCASSCPSRCSGRSSRRAASASSCCGAWRRCARNGASSAPPTIF